MAPARPDTRGDTPAFQALERHQRRREQGIPTLTVLSGPPGLAVPLWSRWLAAHQRPLRTVRTPTEAEAVRAWMDTLARVRDLEADAADFVGAAASLAPGELRSRLKGKTAHEREVLLQELIPAAPSGDLAATCHCLLHAAATPLPDAVLEACGGDPLRALTALHALLPAGTAPGLLLDGSGPEGMSRAAHVANRLCAAVPPLVIALTVEPSTLEAWLHGPESQALARVREGLLQLEAPSPEVLGQRLGALGVPPTWELVGTLARLAADGASDELLALFGEAAREQASRKDTPPEDRARSHAERFLLARLESLPATQGLFQLNASPGFRFGNREAEVDFLSRQLGIAIEIDGYFHFRDVESYRRDRRKDVALQLHGYHVLRFLEEDVVARLEEILDTISEVISHRREGTQGPAPRRDGTHGGD